MPAFVGSMYSLGVSELVDEPMFMNGIVAEVVDVMDQGRCGDVARCRFPPSKLRFREWLGSVYRAAAACPSLSCETS